MRTAEQVYIFTIVRTPSRRLIDDGVNYAAGTGAGRHCNRDDVAICNNRLHLCLFHADA